MDRDFGMWFNSKVLLIIKEEYDMKLNTTVFTDVNKQFIDGSWKEGTLGKEAIIKDPYDNSEFARINLAGKDDIDKAYQAAKSAQKQWSQTTKEEKVAVIEKAIKIMKENKEEIVDIITRETGGTVLKANTEFQLAMDVMHEAKSYPHRMEPKIESSALPGKENRIYRFPVGVVSVISPFNFPLNLSMRSVAPAIAMGNA